MELQKGVNDTIFLYYKNIENIFIKSIFVKEISMRIRRPQERKRNENPEL